MEEAVTTTAQTGNPVPNLGEIAKWQRRLQFLTLATLLAFWPRYGGVFFLALLPFKLFVLYRMITALRMPDLLLLLMFVPVLDLITLLLLSRRATRTLQAAGIRVGLLGASAKDVPEKGSTQTREGNTASP